MCGRWIRQFYPDLRRRGRRESTYDALKRALDLVGSLTLLVGLAPLFLVIAALVSLGSRGPVLFRQVRIGQNDEALHDAEVQDDAVGR